MELRQKRRVGCRNKTTIAAKLAVPDLDLIKQDEQEVQDRRERFPTGRSGIPPAAGSPAATRQP